VLVKPVIAVPTDLLSLLDEIVNAGAASASTVRVNVADAVPEAFVAVIV
jgi:hypothetical protein